MKTDDNGDVQVVIKGQKHKQQQLRQHWKTTKVPQDLHFIAGQINASQSTFSIDPNQSWQIVVPPQQGQSL